MGIVKLKTNRTYYSIDESARDSVTVREFIEMLENENQDDKIVFSNDNGYTYGYIDEGVISGNY